MDLYQASIYLPVEIRDSLREELMKTFPDLSWGKPYDCIDRVIYGLAAVAYDLVEWDFETSKIVVSSAHHMFALHANVGMTIASFVKTRVGYITNQSWLWAQHDAMVSIPEASKLTSLSELTISYLVKNGNLKSFIDPFDHDPQHAIRVIRSKAFGIAAELR
jgi:hypothetical protein